MNGLNGSGHEGFTRPDSLAPAEPDVKPGNAKPPYEDRKLVAAERGQRGPERVVDPPFRRPWEKPHAFALAHGEGGASIWYGCLITVVNRAKFKTYHVGGKQINGLVEQAAVQGGKYHAPSNLVTDHLLQTHLGWYGDVYLYWEINEEGEVGTCDVRGPSEPAGDDLAMLDIDLSRGASPAGQYFLKLGTVEEDSPVDQIVSSDVTWAAMIFTGDDSSESSEDGSSGGSEPPTPSDGSSEASEGSSGSDKSTAIVPVKSSPTGYRAWFTVEATDVRFIDYIKGDLKRRVTRVPVCPVVLECVEADTVLAAGYTADLPCPLGITFDKDAFVVTMPKYLDKEDRPKSVVIQLTAIRKGFMGKRLPTRTEKQFRENEVFLNSAYSAYGK